MNATLYTQRRLQPKPPDKGSFPLDHQGVCKEAMMKYMNCLNDKDMENGQCRDLSKDYLQCRMDHNLMTKEDWRYLGYGKEKKAGETNANTAAQT
ncbi:uncharacterized protein [Watersipora subatra]|uniref:uncharacterized protein n=1 Tax=Watersipora subatra TaxID=2589382 RepID=UPI00355C22AA